MRVLRPPTAARRALGLGDKTPSSSSLGTDPAVLRSGQAHQLDQVCSSQPGPSFVRFLLACFQSLKPARLQKRDLRAHMETMSPAKLGFRVQAVLPVPGLRLRMARMVVLQPAELFL